MIKPTVAFILITLLGLSCIPNFLATRILENAIAQQQPAVQSPTRSQDETIRIGTAEVQLEVIVTDKSGKNIRGLTQSDFEVADEGAVQSVNYFVSIEDSRIAAPADSSSAPANNSPDKTNKTSSAPPGNSISPLAIPYSGRFVALVLDDLSLSNNNFVRSRTALTDYVNQNLGQKDLVALISTAGSFGSLQQFTNDKQRLLSAIKRIGAQTDPLEKLRDPRFDMSAAEAVRIDSGDISVLENVLKRIRIEGNNNPSLGVPDLQRPTGGKSAGAFESTPGRAPEGTVATQVRAAAKSIAAAVAALSRNNLRILEGVFRSMADLPGRKIVVLLTESFVTLRGSSETIANELLQLIDLARRNGVSVYALDAAGLRTNSASASERLTASGYRARSEISSSFSDFDNLGGARELVTDTGGSLIANTNDLTKGIQRAIADSSTYYVVGFKPAVLDNKFHHVSVAIKSRPDLVVRSRRGYLATNQETARGTSAELAAALVSPVPRTELPLQIVANVVPRGEEQVVVTGLHVGHNYLSVPETNAADQAASYDLLAWVFAFGNDRPVGVLQRTLTYDLAKEPDARRKLQSEGLLYVPAQPFALPPGLFQIRAVVREKTSGSVGSAYQFFEVPDAKNQKVVSLSSLVLSAAGQAGFSGKNSFKPGSEIDLRFVIYNLPKDVSGLSQHIKLVSTDGQVLMDSELPLMPSAGQQLHPQGTRLTLPPVRGHYAVLVNLRDAKGKMDLERRADLVID